MSNDQNYPSPTVPQHFNVERTVEDLVAVYPHHRDAKVNLGISRYDPVTGKLDRLPTEITPDMARKIAASLTYYADWVENRPNGGPGGLDLVGEIL